MLSSEKIEIFSISPRTMAPGKYWTDIDNVMKWSEKYGLTGLLLFNGNDTYIDPWLVADRIFTGTRHLSPLVAVNPVYMHPFSAAKMVSSFAYMYKRKTFLNMITGTALNHLQALGDDLDHGERYARLGEYVKVISALTQGRPVSFTGKYYDVRNLHLLPKIPQELLPSFLFAGHSNEATQAASTVAGVQMQMLLPAIGDLAANCRAVHFGVVARAGESEAWEEAKRIFPADEIGRKGLELSMNNTDSVWKARLKKAADLEAGATPGYWLDPFRMFKADCPYFVGSHQQVADLFVRLFNAGMRTFVLDVPAADEEYDNLAKALRLAFGRDNYWAAPASEPATVGWREA